MDVEVSQFSRHDNRRENKLILTGIIYHKKNPLNSFFTHIIFLYL